MKISSLYPIAYTLARELAVTALLLFGISLVVFGILLFAPGDPFASLVSAGEDTSATIAAQTQSQSWLSLYGRWLINIISGDFGNSVRTGQPVMDQILLVGGNTLLLTIASIIFTLAIALPIAVFYALRGITALNWPLSIATYLVSALPVFWIGYIAIYISTHYFDYFPINLGFSSGQSMDFAQIALPVIVLGLGSGIIAEAVRFLQYEISRVLAEEYIRTARSKGASIWRHAFKDGFLLPLSGIVASKIPFILGGAIIVEQIFNWPGLGRMAWQAAQDRDFPVIMAITLISALFVRIGSLAHRIIYIIVNPRASHE